MSCEAKIFTNADRDLAETLFAHVAEATRAGSGGVCRPSYGHAETSALKIVSNVAVDLGLHAQTDAAGNLVVAADAETSGKPAVWVGSHLDSVPVGGNYDGLAGVVAGVLLVAKARAQKVAVPIVALGLRGEESAWFGVPYLGSKAILGKLSQRDLDRRRRATEEDTGLPLASCMEKIGVDPARLVTGAPVVTVDQVREFWELHIEQGPVLVARDKPVGVVTGIRGSARAPRAKILGKAGHSGTTPHEMRDDAVARFAEVMTKLEARRRTLAEFGDDLVFTCRMVGTDPAKHSMTTIADEVTFSLDVRSIQHHHAVQFLSYAEAIGVALGEVVETPGARINAPIWQRAARTCADLGVSYELMPSGAGHDGGDLPAGRDTDGHAVRAQRPRQPQPRRGHGH